MGTREIITTCRICGDLVRSAVEPNWHPGKRVLRAYKDMQQHLTTHSFAELLRFEIRQDLDQVPDEQRPWIVRDIYRSLLGTADESGYCLGAADSQGVYTIDEALGDLDTYRLWRAANRCGDPRCAQH